MKARSAGHSVKKSMSDQHTISPPVALKVPEYCTSPFLDGSQTLEVRVRGRPERDSVQIEKKQFEDHFAGRRLSLAQL